MIRTGRALLAVVVAVSLAVAGCAGSSGNTASSAPVVTSSSVGSAGAAPNADASSSTALSTSAPSSSGSSSTASGGGELSGTVTVFAAASLQKTFDELTATFEKEHPGVDVQVSYDGSSTLVTQLTQGAEADVFASADQNNMTKATDAGLIDGTPTVFATNTLQIAVKPGNPKDITDLAGLAKSGVATVVCAPEVPCGSAARTALQAAGVTLDPASEEQNVTDVLTKVAEGDADAGLVYKTDVAGSGGKVEGIDFTESAQAINSYPIGVLKDAPNPAAAAAFVDVVTGAEGRKTLASAGFGAP